MIMIVEQVDLPPLAIDSVPRAATVLCALKSAAIDVQFAGGIDEDRAVPVAERAPLLTLRLGRRYCDRDRRRSSGLWQRFAQKDALAPLHAVTLPLMTFPWALNVHARDVDHAVLPEGNVARAGCENAAAVER